jgi:hypothetical protein
MKERVAVVRHCGQRGGRGTYHQLVEEIAVRCVFQNQALFHTVVERLQQLHYMRVRWD